MVELVAHGQGGSDRWAERTGSENRRKGEAAGVTRHLESRGRGSAREGRGTGSPSVGPWVFPPDAPRESRGGGRVPPVCEVEVTQQGR